MNTTDLYETHRIMEIKSEALLEIYDGSIDFGHISLNDFFDWAKIMRPHFAKIPGFENIFEFDIKSMMNLFEEWVNGKHDKEIYNPSQNEVYLSLLKHEL